MNKLMGLILPPPDPATLAVLAVSQRHKFLFTDSLGKKPRAYHRAGPGPSYTFPPRPETTQTLTVVTYSTFSLCSKSEMQVDKSNQAKVTEMPCIQQHPTAAGHGVNQHSCSSKLESFTAAASSQAP